MSAPIPVPITFETDEDLLTDNGERAAALLAEYLKLKQPAGITLSGHADARGSDGYNMRLSLKRLKAIERYLRAAGYSGALSLVPRGKREPYQGVDRRHLPLREIYQADRRVELRITP
jgi:outer membrane protein OmpA-like peptidoglycan-associated protein